MWYPLRKAKLGFAQRGTGRTMQHAGCQAEEELRYWSLIRARSVWLTADSRQPRFSIVKQQTPRKCGVDAM
jgi:hypothetical protein